MLIYVHMNTMSAKPKRRTITENIANTIEDFVLVTLISNGEDLGPTVQLS